MKKRKKGMKIMKNNLKNKIKMKKGLKSLIKT